MEEEIIYDPTDDLDESEVTYEGAADNTSINNDDIFTDDYMTDLANQIDIDNRRAKIIDTAVSVGVISGIILYVYILTLIFF